MLWIEAQRTVNRSHNRGRRPQLDTFSSNGVGSIEIAKCAIFGTTWVKPCDTRAYFLPGSRAKDEQTKWRPAVLPWGRERGGGGVGEVAIRTSRILGPQRRCQEKHRSWKKNSSQNTLFFNSFYSFNLLLNCPWSWIHEDCFLVQTWVKKKINKHVHVILSYCAFLAVH